MITFLGFIARIKLIAHLHLMQLGIEYNDVYPFVYDGFCWICFNVLYFSKEYKFKHNHY